MEQFKVEINGHVKQFKSSSLNYNFNLRNGFLSTWGKNPEDDPDCSSFGPLIADIEITDVCSGINGKLCKYCYKSNTPTGSNMSLATFKNVINNLNANGQLTQVAFGLGSTGEENPELWDMCSWLRSINVIPNGTVANISQATAIKIAKNFGACAVSCHILNGKEGREVCYNSVNMLSKLGLKQTNIHYVLCQETYVYIDQLFEDIKNDPRLSALNAVVFLSLKQRGRAVDNKLHPISQEQFSALIDKALKAHINFGFDSCSCHRFLKAIKGHPKEEQFKILSEPCESFGLFSSYVNVEGKYFPCSFSEDIFEGIDVSKPIPNFIEKVWNSKFVDFGRQHSLKYGRKCIIYNLDNSDEGIISQCSHTNSLGVKKCTFVNPVKKNLKK